MTFNTAAEDKVCVIFFNACHEETSTAQRDRAFLHSLHALLEDGVPPGLTDDQISPLHNDNADEEGCVAGELHDLSLLVGLIEKAHTRIVNTRW